MLVNLKEILKIAEEEKNAVGMFNATGFDSLQAVIGAAEEKSGFNCFFGERIFPPFKKKSSTDTENEAK